MSGERRPSGLSSKEAASLARALGPNVLVPTQRRTGPVWVFAKALGDPMALLLLAASVTYFVIGEKLDALVTSLAIVPVVAVTLILEFRAESALARLREAIQPQVTVIRDGVERQVPISQLVPGDLVIVKEGDVIPADGSIVETTQLSVDESALTGESLPVEKSAVDRTSAEPSDSSVHAGTVVLAGRALFRVESIGAETSYGRLARTVARSKPGPTPLQRMIRRLVVRLGLVAAIFCGAVIATELIYGHGLASAVTAGVSLGIAAVPEEFTIVFTLFLSVGAWRLAKQAALVKRMTSVEALGSTTVICTDKTGTLTEGKLRVAGLWSASGRAEDLLEAAILASEPDPFDPLEQAILDHAKSLSVDVRRIQLEDLVFDHEFDPRRKYMSHVWRVDGKYLTFAKGSPETIFDLSGIDGALEGEAQRFAEGAASQGMRLIAVAKGEASESPGDRRADESKLCIAGLIAFSDSPRPGVAEAIAACRSAGIRVVMLTGDHPITASAIGEGLGLLDRRPDSEAIDDSDSVALGDELDSASDEEFDRIVGNAVVLARIRPEQKYDIVKHLKGRGEVVAMTGDGINDAPALREADVGVAMGIRGTEVARAAADIVLLDDNFSTIVAAVRSGRRIFDNLSRAFSYLVAFHIPLLAAALFIPLARLPLLLLPLHLVLLEILLHPTVSLAFENEPADPDVMKRPPRSPRENLLSFRLLARPVVAGLALFLAVAAIYVVSLRMGAEIEKARTAAFSALVVGDIALLLAELRPREYFWRAGTRGNRSVVPLSIGSIGILLLAVYLPDANRILHLSPISVWELVGYAAIAVGAVAITEPLKHLSFAGHLPAAS